MRHWIPAALIAAATALPVSAATIPGGFTGLVAYGDSLSDPGRVGPSIGPYSGNRFSNGPVWAEKLGDLFQAVGDPVVNLARGLATVAGADPGAGAGTLARLGTFAGQRGVLSDQLGGAGLGANPLTAVWLGANDLIALLSTATPTAAQARGVADALVGGIAQIAALDPIFDDFLVLGLPSLGDIPRFKGTPLQGTAASLTSAFNDQLSMGLTGLETAGLDTAYVDIASLFGSALADPASFGFTDATTPCVTVPACFLGLIDANNFVFIDDVHPTERAHQFVADLAESTAQAQLAPIPLPASLPLLAFGFCGLIAVRRRTG